MSWSFHVIIIVFIGLYGNASFAKESSPPKLVKQCPKSVHQPTDPDSDVAAWVFWDEPKAISNSSIAKTSIPASISSPWRFSLGVTTVRYTFTDEYGLSTSCAFKIHIHERLRIKKRPPKTINILPGARNFILECAASGHGRVMYEWYKADEKFKSTLHAKIVHDKGLEFSDLVPEDSGRYRCEASVEGDAGIESAEVSLYVTRSISWSKWSKWTKCSSGCKDGITFRVRHCVTHSGDDALGCQGPQVERRVCHGTCKRPRRNSHDSNPSRENTKRMNTGHGKRRQEADRAFSPPLHERIKEKGRRLHAHFKKFKTKAHAHFQQLKATYVNKFNRFVGSFYGKLAVISSAAILLVASCCCCFMCIGHHYEKKERKERARREPLIYEDVENPPLPPEYTIPTQPAEVVVEILSEPPRPTEPATEPAREEVIEVADSVPDLYDPREELLDRKAYEKRKVIKELTPQRRKSSLVEELEIAKAVILEDGRDREHERRVSEKRKVIAKTTSSPDCKFSLLASINKSKSIILDEGVDKEHEEWVSDNRGVIRQKTETRRHSLIYQIQIARSVIFEEPEIEENHSKDQKAQEKQCTQAKPVVRFDTKPANGASSRNQTTSESPTTGLPSTSCSNVVNPTTVLPSTTCSNVVSPTTGLPSTSYSNVVSPTTGLPSTSYSNVVSPTTGLPSTSYSNGVSPTTVLPSTSNSNVVSPTTGLPSTSYSNVVSPTTGLPSTSCFNVTRLPRIDSGTAMESGSSTEDQSTTTCGHLRYPSTQAVVGGRGRSQEEWERQVLDFASNRWLSEDSPTSDDD